MFRLAPLLLALFVPAPDAPPDPVPLRRVVTARLPDPPPGGLRELPRAEFEALVRRAAGRPPRLVECRLRAALTDTGLTGTGEWAVSHAGPAAALPLDPLRPAVWNPKWAGGADAILFRQPGGPAALWVEPGGGAVAFDWSLRGTEETGDLRFDLRVPPAPVAELALDLPAGRVPVAAPADALVTGPLPAAAGRAGWRLLFGGRERVEFVVRGAAGQLPPLARVSSAARLDLAAGQAACRYEFAFDALRGPADALEFEADPGLRVLDVAAAGRDGWRMTAPNRLTVSFREPAAAGRVVVTAVAAFPADGKAWPCPRVRPLAVAGGEETVEVRFGPDLRPGGWDANDFRLTTSASAPDGGYALAFRGSLTDAAARRPPAVRAAPAGPAFATTEDVQWKIEPGQSTLAARVRVNVLRGPVARLTFRLPDGYTAGPAAPMPDDSAALAAAGPGGTWVVEPSRPLATGAAAEVRLTLRGPPGPPAGDPAAVPGRTAVPFPVLAVVGAATRDGVFTVAPGPAYRAWASPPAAGFVYRYSGEPPAGRLMLAPKRPGVAVDGETAVSLAGDRLTTVTRLRPRGPAGGLTVFAPAGWNWALTADAGATVRPHPAGPLLPWLPVLAGGWPVGPAGELWHVTPPHGATEWELTATATGPAARGGVPVPVVLGADQPPHPVALDAAAAARFAPPDDPPADAALLRLVPLKPRGTDPPAGRGWRFADVGRLTRVGPDGSVVVTLSGRVVEAAGPAFPVELPAGAAVEAVTVGGRAANGPRVWVPVPDPGPNGVGFEVRYRLAGPVAAATDRVSSPPPRLPGDPAVRSAWATGPAALVWPALVPFAAGGDSVRVVDARLPAAAGWALAAVLAAAGLVWLRGSPRRGTWAVTAAVAVGLGLAAVAAPDGWRAALAPPLAVCLTVLLVGSARLARAVPVAACVLAAAAAPSVADAPGPAVVYVVPGPAGESVFAPPTLLDRLTSLAPSGRPPVVLTAAEYAGHEANGTARFTARFALHSAAAGEQLLRLPLTGVRLDELTLDGAAAFPDGAAGDAFAVAVRGAGRHELVAKFAVPVAAVGADREVRFAGPDLPAARLTFIPPAGARQFAVPSRRGCLTSGPDVKADLGGGRDVVLRWRAGGRAAGRATVGVTAACVWDLGEDEAAATAGFVYKVDGGSLARLRFELPPGWEPGRAAVRPLDAPAALAGVKGWSLDPPGADGWRRLTVVPQTPAEGAVAVVFRLLRTGPPHDRPPLLPPRAADATSTESFAAVRLGGVAADAWEKAGLLDFPAGAVQKALAAVPELELEKRPPARAFRQDGPAAPFVRPTLRAPAPPRPTGHEITWTLGPRADAAGAVRWKEPAAAVAFDVPPTVTVSDVRADLLGGWVQAGPRVQAWFRGPVREPVVRWAGSAPVPAAADPAAVELPFPPGAGDGVVMAARPADGWAMAQPAAFTPAANAPPPRVLVYPPLPDRPVRVEQTPDADGGWRGEVRVSLRAGRPQAFGVRVGGAGAKLEAPAGVHVAEVVPGKEWALTAGGPVRLTLSGKPGGRGGLPVVDVLFAGVPSAKTERYVHPGPRVRPAGGGWETPRDGWRVRPAEPVRLTDDPGPPAPPAPPAPRPTADAATEPEVGPEVLAAGWAVAFALAAAFALRGPRRLGPERVAVLAAASAAVGGWAFLLAAAGAVAVRLGWAVRRLV